MLIEFCHAKITYATITQAELFYEGSITVDSAILTAADIIPGQKVQIVNLNNGERFDTYTIAGEAGSGTVCLNGPAARLGVVGDRIHILSYALIEKNKARDMSTRVVALDKDNKIQS